MFSFFQNSITELLKVDRWAKAVKLLFPLVQYVIYNEEPQSQGPQRNQYSLKWGGGLRLHWELNEYRKRLMGSVQISI